MDSYATQASGRSGAANDVIDVDAEDDEESLMLASARAALTASSSKSVAARQGAANINADEELAAALQADEFNFASSAAPSWRGGSSSDDTYGLLEPSQTIVLRTYGDDGDDRVLAEIMPRYIVMYEPSREFVRRVEVSVIRHSICLSGTDNRIMYTPLFVST